MMATSPPSPAHNTLFMPSSPSPSRKRQYDYGSTPLETPSGKRQRVNLASGLSGLSISGKPFIPPSLGETTNDYPEEGRLQADGSDGSSQTVTLDRDLRVEELPSRSTNSWLPDVSSTETSSTEDTDFDGAHPSTWSRRRFAKTAQQADEIEHPPEPNGTSHNIGRDIHVEDISHEPEWRSGKAGKRKNIEYETSRPKRKRRRARSDMDDDMNGVQSDDDDIEEIDRRPARRKTSWHEPEKDRIVITSIGSSDSEGSSSSRSPSPIPESERHLAQPGSDGFTLSPSLLTHLLRAQKRHFVAPKKKPQDLVLYRPIQMPSLWPIVNEWQGEPHLSQADSSRFEEINDDEEVGGGQGDGMVLDHGQSNMQTGGAGSHELSTVTDGYPGQPEEDMSMDVE